MKEGSWNECLESGDALKASREVLRAKSLIETAKDRISLISSINSKNCNFVFEDYYTSLLVSRLRPN